MIERNIELLETTMQHLKDHPEQHRQSSWGHIEPECGVVGCYAGWAIMLSGMPYEFVHDHDTCEVPTLVAERSTREAARNLLGLTDNEAYALFASSNTLVELELMVKKLVNGERV